MKTAEMTIKNCYITGDTHGAVSNRVDTLLANLPHLPHLIPEETALIVLGDLGLNYYLGKKDQRNKKEVEAMGVYIYAVRGNHEARPSEKLGMKIVNDDFVNGAVWIEDEFPHIRYFCDWGHYNIQGKKTLVVGGAYSVDKHYRLQQGFKWFEDEQLTPLEMDACLRNAKDCKFDLVLTHTCPREFQPTDLFLGFINQATVDNSMEVWMDELKNNIQWGIWCFGHYHRDRIELPHVEQFYWEIESLDTIFERWARYDKTKELDWWLPLSPWMERLMESE